MITGDSTSEDDSNTGAIVGGVVGGIVAAIIIIILIILIVYCVMKGRDKSSRPSKEHVCNAILTYIMSPYLCNKDVYITHMYIT